MQWKITRLAWSIFIEEKTKTLGDFRVFFLKKVVPRQFEEFKITPNTNIIYRQ